MSKFVRVTGYCDDETIWIDREKIAFILPERDEETGEVSSRIFFGHSFWIHAKLDPSTLMMKEIGT